MTRTMKVVGTQKRINQLVAREGVGWERQGLIGGKQPFIEIRVRDDVPFKGAWLQADGTVTCGFINPSLVEPHRFASIDQFLEAVT